MKINDLEKCTGLKRSQIFYYEREGLIAPRREDNNYREYSEDDLRRLKTVVVLRKLGITVAEIRELLEGTRALSDVLPENLARLETRAKELEAARRLCRDMKRQGVAMESFDADGWFETIETEERSGHRFPDILGDGVVFTADEYGPRKYSSRLMLSDGTVVEPVYEARFAEGYLPLYALEVPREQACTGLEFGVDEAGGIHYEIDRVQYAGSSHWTTPPHYNESKTLVSTEQLLSTAAGTEFLDAYRTWRGALWETEPLLESRASTLGVNGDYVLWAAYYAPSCLTVHPADVYGIITEWGANLFSECVYIPENREPYYTWQMLCGAEIDALLTAEATPELMRAAAATAAATDIVQPEPGVLVSAEDSLRPITRYWKVTLPEDLIDLGSRTFWELNGAG